MNLHRSYSGTPMLDGAGGGPDGGRRHDSGDWQRVSAEADRDLLGGENWLDANAEDERGRTRLHDAWAARDEPSAGEYV